MASLEHNRRIARQSWEEWFNAHDPEAAERFFGREFENHAVPGVARGPASMANLIGILETGFPDFSMTVEDEVAEGSKVVHRTTFRGTHAGPFYGLPGAGMRIEEMHVHIFRFEDGLIAEHWGIRHELPTVLHLGAKVVPG